MDDLIVIILTLLIAVAGALGQIKKKKAETAANKAPENQDSFWDLLSEEEEEPEPVAVETEASEILKTDTKPKYSFTAQEEGQFTEKKEPEKPTKKIIADIKQKEKFSLRKAVIYSEILNRKYT